jgi:hypothetical protein
VNACIAERGGHFQHLILLCFFFSDFIVIYSLKNRTCVRNDFSITLYKQRKHIRCYRKYKNNCFTEIRPVNKNECLPFLFSIGLSIPGH